MTETATALVPLLETKLGEIVASAVVSSIFGALTALLVFWFKSREPLAATVAWRWHWSPDFPSSEEPFLVIQNRSKIPSFVKQARLLKGSYVRREARQFAFGYDDPEDVNFPLKLHPETITSFPLVTHWADDLFANARWFNKAIGYVFKRPYLWVEITTISGRKVVVPANDSASWKNRPLWIDLRWFPR